LRLSPVVDEGEVAHAMRGKVSDRVKRFNSGPKATFNRLNEEDENDTNEDHIKGSLNSQNNIHASRTIQPKLTYQKPQLNSSPERVKHGWKNDILKTAAKQMELRYYRVIYPGVVSLLADLPGAAGTSLPPSESNSTENGVFLGYGEIVATSSPEITISLSELEVQLAGGWC
jgi:hypothetical protein